jgi:hypothetical protein
VLASSPVLLNGSMRKDPPSISPTLRSLPVLWLPLEDCVPPVIVSVFPSSESLGMNSGSTEDSNSGGALSEPTRGISFVNVEVVFVI